MYRVGNTFGCRVQRARQDAHAQTEGWWVLYNWTRTLSSRCLSLYTGNRACSKGKICNWVSYFASLANIKNDINVHVLWVLTVKRDIEIMYFLQMSRFILSFIEKLSWQLILEHYSYVCTRRLDELTSRYHSHRCTRWIKRYFSWYFMFSYEWSSKCRNNEHIDTY